MNVEWEDGLMPGVMLLTLGPLYHAVAARFADGRFGSKIDRDGETLMVADGLDGMDAAASAVEAWLEQHDPRGAELRPTLARIRMYAPYRITG
jgi:hypothetical protein